MMMMMMTTMMIQIIIIIITEPFYDVEFGTPEQIQMSVSTGITIFCLWRRYLELKKMRLHAFPNASKIIEKRGHFLTYGAYTTAELIFSAASSHCIEMFCTSRSLAHHYAPQIVLVQFQQKKSLASYKGKLLISKLWTHHQHLAIC